MEVGALLAGPLMRVVVWLVGHAHLSCLKLRQCIAIDVTFIRSSKGALTTSVTWYWLQPFIHNRCSGKKANQHMPKVRAVVYWQIPVDQGVTPHMPTTHQGCHQLLAVAHVAAVEPIRKGRMVGLAAGTPQQRCC
jgi:hypothetical protein